MISSSDVNRLTGAEVFGRPAARSALLARCISTTQTGNPEWISVQTGWFGMKESFVPLAQATSTGDSVQVPYDKDVVKDAPRIDAHGELSPAEEADLYAYYGVSYGDSPPTASVVTWARTGVQWDGTCPARRPTTR
jgi:hypothetical protein